MIRESRQEKKIKAGLRAKFRLKQRLEYIDWEMDELMPKVNEFLDRATLPEPPSEHVIDVVFTDETPSRDKRKHKKGS